MKQLQLVRVQVSDLVLGMYVAELDRPWLGTPFTAEAFQLQDSEQLSQLRIFCRLVLVDVIQSHEDCRSLLLSMATDQTSVLLKAAAHPPSFLADHREMTKKSDMPTGVRQDRPRQTGLD